MNSASSFRLSAVVPGLSEADGEFFGLIWRVNSPTHATTKLEMGLLYILSWYPSSNSRSSSLSKLSTCTWPCSEPFTSSSPQEQASCLLALSIAICLWKRCDEIFVDFCWRRGMEVYIQVLRSFSGVVGRYSRFYHSRNLGVPATLTQTKACSCTM